MKGKRIIVIDDCKLTLAMARDILEEAGHQVVTAETGIEANEHIYGLPRPELILIDVVMPMLNGDRKVRLLKDREVSREIPVVLMSTKSEEELHELAAASGADGFLQKPLTHEKLLGLVERFL